MRRLSLSNKKPRGVPRRLRALRRWAEEFAGWFPADLVPEEGYCNWKIPVLMNLVEGSHAQEAVQAQCAQQLIDACGHLMAAKPESARNFRVTCVICLPDMFTSEVCIYMDEDRFRGHTEPGKNEYGETKLIEGRSLALEWGLRLPEGVYELGVSVDYHSEEDDWYLVGECWYFGEVLPQHSSATSGRDK